MVIFFSPSPSAQPLTIEKKPYRIQNIKHGRLIIDAITIFNLGIRDDGRIDDAQTTLRGFFFHISTQYI